MTSTNLLFANNSEFTGIPLFTKNVLYSVYMCACIRGPFSLELELCESTSCLVQVLGTGPEPSRSPEPCLQPTRCCFLRAIYVVGTCYTTCRSGHCNTGNTCSPIPTTCRVFSEGGKTWCIWIHPGLSVLHAQRLPLG